MTSPSPNTGRRTGRLEVLDVGPAFGIERASHLRFRGAAEDAEKDLPPLALWAVEHLPVWWGTGGWFLERGAGRLAGRRLATLAKRFWCAQVLDMTALQWDALRGMPGVNWLNLVGAEFAVHAGLDLEGLAGAGCACAARGVFLRRGRNAIVLATGAAPSQGDINRDEGMHGYVAVAQCVAPLLLAEPTLSASFESAEQLAAWMGRFSLPHRWLDAEVAEVG